MNETDVSVGRSENLERREVIEELMEHVSLLFMIISGGRG